MRERFYTTAELARICGVSISTIKRWTDSGLLRCVRTPGGHRKFRLQDVADAARQLDTCMTVPESPPAATMDALSLLLLQRSPDSLVTHLADTLARGDDAGVRRWLTELHRHGLPVHTIAGEVLLGAVDAVGAGTADDFVRRRAARLVEMGVRHLVSELPPPVPGAPRALLAGTSGTSESLCLVLGALVLAGAGWERVDLGPGVPASTLHAGLAAVQPQLLVLATAGGNATAAVSPGGAPDDLAALGQACREAGVGLCLLPGEDPPSAALAALQQTARTHKPLPERAAALEHVHVRRGFPRVTVA